jgi:DNA-binding transcriptional ArsR family regulator
VDVFAAIADPTRRQVLEMLRSRDHSAGELLAAFPELSQPAISRHLRVLREVGLVRVRPEEQRRIYSLDHAGFAVLDAWIGDYQRFWQGRLDALERYLDARAAQSEPSNKENTP